MDIISDQSDFYLERCTSVAIGKFDGLHRGHKRLLGEILDREREGLSSCVFTFNPPASAFFGTGDEKELTTREEKRMLFRQMGVDILIEYPLNDTTAAMEPERFISDVLVGRMNVRFVAAGTDLSFGAGGRGNAALLEKMSGVYSYQTKIIDKICHEGREISSTYVREMVEAGNMSVAGQLLGEPYMVFGRVCHGRMLGRKMGIPTINLIPDTNKLMPPRGVYYSTVSVDGKKYRSISNLGYKPTVSDEHVLTLESYMYDFVGDLYDRDVVVNLIEFKRPESKFPDMEALKKQISLDISDGEDFFARL